MSLRSSRFSKLRVRTAQAYPWIQHIARTREKYWLLFCTIYQTAYSLRFKRNTAKQRIRILDVFLYLLIYNFRDVSHICQPDKTKLLMKFTISCAVVIHENIAIVRSCTMFEDERSCVKLREWHGLNLKLQLACYVSDTHVILAIFY